MSSQRQDLVFFNDNSIIPQQVLANSQSYLSIISYLQGTSPTWLVDSLIENALLGTGTLVNNDLNVKTPNRSEVFFVSFNHSQDFYNKNCKKNGIDLSNLSNFKFIDCFSNLFTKLITTPQDCFGQFKKLMDDILKQVQASKAQSKVIFIESPELLLLSSNITSDQFLFEILKLNRLAKQMFIITPQDSLLIDLSISSDQDPVFKISDFLTKLYHRSNLNLNLQPLSTGRANDITGCLTISKGLIPYELANLQVIEKEYIYHISKEFSIKLFFR